MSARKSEFPKRTSFSFSVQPTTIMNKDEACLDKTSEKYKIYSFDPDKTFASEQWPTQT